MKVIDLGNRIIFTNTIIETYKKEEYGNYFTYYVKTTNGDYSIIKSIYNEINEYLLSLNKTTYKNTPKEDKKIEKLDRGETIYKDAGSWGAIIKTKEWTDNELEILDKLDEIIERINGE